MPIQNSGGLVQASDKSGVQLHEFLTVREAATILRVTPRTVYTWVRTGRLYAYKLGHTWRIPRQAAVTEENGTDGYV